MSTNPEAKPKAGNSFALVADDISQYAYKTWDELFSLPRRDVEAFQLKAAQRRFDELLPRVAALRAQAARHDVAHIACLDDLVPLLFDHVVYKSYPIALLERNRFDQLTAWLQKMTTIDLSGVNVSGCESIDEWMDRLESQTPLQLFHTSGTTGKLSFIPRTTLELDLLLHVYLWAFTRGFGSEPSTVIGPGGDKVPVIFPSARHGRYVTQRMVNYMAEQVAPSPDQCYTMNNGTLSADLISLAGRIRVAQASGSLREMILSESQRVALKRYMAELERRPEETAAFFGSMIDKLRGQRVFLFAQSSYLVKASREGLARGLREVFAADSAGSSGGGGKDIVLPPNWLDLVGDFTGIRRWRMNYGMSEVAGLFTGCAHGHFHAPAYVVPFLVEPESLAVLPRQGVQTGRLGALDLLAQTYWGGILSGDMVTIDWDGACPCGRLGAYAHDSVTRYSAAITGDDKITCAATIDTTDHALQQLLS